MIGPISYLNDNLLRPRADELLHLIIVLVNSFSKNDDHNAD